MDKSEFDELMTSVKQADQILSGAAEPARVTQVTAYRVKQIRESLQLTQTQFARLIRVDVATIRNWEQGRRKPDGAAISLLTALGNDPEHVIPAINA